MKWITLIVLMCPLAGIGQTYECDFVNTDQLLHEEKTVITHKDGNVSMFSEEDTVKITAADVMMVSLGSTVVVIDIVGNTYMFRVCKQIYAKQPEPVQVADTIKH